MALAVTFLIHSCKGQNNSPSSSDSQNKIVGGGCDGCELMFVGMPESLIATDTSLGWHSDKGQKLKITGTVYHHDGKTPSENVILYYWHTDHTGYYTPNDSMDSRARRHGQLRGWVKTDNDGKYAIYTIRPAPYPENNSPAHIHLSVKEPEIENEYYIDEWVFDDDSLLTSSLRKQHENRGGSGILNVQNLDKIQIAEQNIILGLNVPHYPKSD
jgi:protocatechuate 3,4-dioxygenase beta subunit